LFCEGHFSPGRSDAGHVVVNAAIQAILAAETHVLELPTTDNRACCDSAEKVTTLFEQAGVDLGRVW